MGDIIPAEPHVDAEIDSRKATTLGFRAWRLDFESCAPDRQQASQDPPGFDAKLAREAAPPSSASRKKDSGMLARKQQALYARATAPLKGIGMMCFMAWMMGNGIQIFSIIMTFSILAQPFSAIANSGQMFPKEPEWPQLDVTLPRILYCLVHSLQLVFGLHRLNSMGLLPVYPSDWVSSMQVPRTLEQSLAAS